MPPEHARRQGGWFIFLTILLAMMLGIVPLPAWLEVWRPEWIALVLVYWVIALPHRVGLFTAWFTGICIDVLEGSLLGLNAISLTLIAYVALSLYQRLRMFTPVQQSITLMMLVGVQQLLVFWVLTATGQNTPNDMMFVVSALSSALLWPVIFVALRHGRRALQVR